VGVSVWATFDVEFSLGKIAGTLLGVFAFLAGIQWLDRDRRFWIAVGLFCAAGVGFALLGFLITPFSPKLPLIRAVIPYLPPRLPVPVPEGALNANPVGGSLVLFLPLLGVLGWTLSTGKLHGAWLRRLGWVILAGGTGTFGVLVLSQSRSALVGFVVSVGLLMIFRYRWLRWVALGVVVLSVVGLLLWAPWNQEAVGDVVESGAGEMGLTARMEIWDRAIYGIQDFPFTGMGMNAFRKVVHVLYPLFLISPDTDIASAHNQLLQTALDLGIPGLVAYVGIWAALGRMLWLAGRRGSDRLRRVLVLGIGCGLAAQLTYMMTDAVPLGAKLGIFWWAALTLGVAAFKLEFGEVNIGRWRVLEVMLTWILLSLVAISFVGDYPYVSLGIAVVGGIYLGFLSVPGVDLLRETSAP
jgi:putative inorganic carbon (HCO3(-)) transporter